ncbi:MAG: DUF4127 family protein [Armatimonadota bacterium]|nr:DUF4127 family protein [Armatimonadota bacterium]MDR7427702.1 DUF4127 family protein [Armatimonadota bacterium]MDR7470271.1 DUF4127 family protein [Armatimonadota bacterium]MDR7475370.1 DUF4127 family protein [Armatimonadota bacterium]MDR7539778.1 DUF4127 family protein [Armatimonadota bacterium]
MNCFFIPLDDRPVTRDAVLHLAAAVGVTVHTPPRALLGGPDRPGDVRALWAWVHRQLAQEPPAACIASAEMLCFGGLVASRRATPQWRNLLPWLDDLYALAATVPTYVSAVIPRTPLAAGGGEDPGYWEIHGEALRAYSAAADRYAWMGDAAAARQLAEALERLPAGVVEAVLQHRRRHLLVNAELVLAASRGTLRAVLVGQDDTTITGLSRMDREVLERLAAVAAAANVIITSGADELGAVLFARWLNAVAGARPAVRVAYTFPQARDRVAAYEATPLAQSVREHVEATGCRLVSSGEEILLWVHNFAEDQQREAHDQDDVVDDAGAVAVRLAEEAAGGRPVALADVRYANGADRSLVAALLQRSAFGGVAAYAGWNTASNALGSAVAQAVTVWHLGRGIPGDPAAARQMLLARLLDDWGYQAVVRPRLAALLQARGSNPAALGADEPGLEAAAGELFAEHVLPPLAASFGIHIALQRVTFPWHRLFEAAVEVDVV